jgi:hypothetical protein
MTRESRTLVGVLLAVAAAHGCASHAHTNAGALHNLRECPLVASESTGAWKPTDAGGGFSVRLPSDCAVDRASSESVRRWRCGATTVEIAHGQWGEKAFRDGGGSACRAMLEQVPVALFTRSEKTEERRLAWYLDGHGNGPHPVVTAWGPKGTDPARLEAIVRSGAFAAVAHR